MSEPEELDPFVSETITQTVNGTTLTTTVNVKQTVSRRSMVLEKKETV